MNKDFFIIPFNTDTHGPGSHWCLAVADIREKALYLFDSARTKTTSVGRIRLLLIYLLGAAHKVADAPFCHEEWEFFQADDAPRQPNGCDCGVYTILNAFTAITGKVYNKINSETTRLWIRRNILLSYENHYARTYSSCKIRTLSDYSDVYHDILEKVQHITTTFDAANKPLMNTLASLVKVQELSLNWTKCCAENDGSNILHQIFLLLVPQLV